MNERTATLVAVTNLKGGVGKSTISSIIASKLDNIKDIKACVFNIAKGQSAETINEVETIDYSSLLAIDNTTTVSEAIADLMGKYDYVFVDTAGDISKELVEIINYIHYFIVPFDRGQRVFEDTITYLKSIFISGIMEDDEHNITLVHNKFKYNSNKYKSQTEQLDEIKNKYYKELNQIAKENNISFNLNFTSLSNSDVVETMEEEKKSIDSLVGTNAAAYRIFNKKADTMVESIIEHMNEVLGE